MFQQLIEHFNVFLHNSLEQKASKNIKAAQFIYPLNKSLLCKTSKNVFSTSETQYIWKKPKENLLFHSIGRMNTEKVFGFNKMIFKKETFNHLKSEIMVNKETGILKRIPLFCGNAEFAPFSDNSVWNGSFNINWFIPKLLLLLDNTNCWLVYNYSLENEKNFILDEFIKYSELIFACKDTSSDRSALLNRKDTDFGTWKNLVDSALAEISNKTFSKVVISRKTEFDLSGTFNMNQMDEIAEKYPDCVTFVNKCNGSVFFGVTPERLLKISEGTIETEAIAGSIKRSIQPDEDILLSEKLLNSSKDLHEQELVTDYIKSILQNYAEDISFNGGPELIKLENIQHLKTKIKAKLKKDKFFFDLVNELHPTPAVCGYPKEAALNFILKNEGYERGLYSGITGWFNLYEEGEFAVAIRSALINKDKLYAFSGCGIVEGSNAMSEYEETELKLKPILSIFGYENQNK